MNKEATNMLSHALRKGLIPWRRYSSNCYLPTNVITGRRYAGVNPLLLQIQGRGSHLWGTEIQWNAIGGTVRSTSRGAEVFLNGKPWTVYNLEEVDGNTFYKCHYFAEYDKAEKIVQATKADIRPQFGKESAYYYPPNDYIIFPLKSQFIDLYGYYDSLGHELAHWTEPRLKWRLQGYPEPMRYALTEMRAEMVGAYLAIECGIPSMSQRVNHDEHLGLWLEAMAKDNTIISKIALAACESVDYILSFSQIVPKRFGTAA